MNPITITVPNVAHGTLLKGAVSSSNPKVRRVTLWLFRASDRPADGDWKAVKRTRLWSKSLHPLGAFSRRSSNLAPGDYVMVAHVPKEPGSVAGDALAEAAFAITAA